MQTPSIEDTLGLNSKSRPVVKWLGYTAIAGIILVAGWALILRNEGAADVEYTTSPAEIAGFRVIVTATGSVEPTNLVEVSSELSGTLESVMVDYNDRVEVGTILAELDTTKLEAQMAVRRAALDATIARVAMAEASLEEAREKYQTSFDLSERGVTAHQALVTHRAAYVRASAELQSAIADRSLAEANVDLQQAELDQACICSPIMGVVLDRAVDAGQIVASALSAPVLFTIAEDLREMELRVDIDEADIGLVEVGDVAKFTVDAYDDRVFPAEIAEIRFAPETIDGVVTYKAILTINNSELLLRPGMTATADITVAEVSDALTVPNAAIRYAPPVDLAAEDDRSGLLGMLIPDDGPETGRGNDRTVWVLRDDIATEIAIETGLSDGLLTEVLGGEIDPGDLVITDQSDG